MPLAESISGTGRVFNSANVFFFSPLYIMLGQKSRYTFSIRRRLPRNANKEKAINANRPFFTPSRTVPLSFLFSRGLFYE